MFERRLQILLAVLGLVLFCVVLRAVAVQVVGRTYWLDASTVAQQRGTMIATTRGRILDRKGRELAVDLPCIDACVDYRAIQFDRSTDDDVIWLRNIARPRVKARVDNYNDLSLPERKRLLAAEVEVVQADIDRMWVILAAAANMSTDGMNDLRRNIVSSVQNRRQIVWAGKYKTAIKKAPAERPWYVRWFAGDGEADVGKFEVDVAEQSSAHVILPNIAYALRNELTRNLDHYPGLVIQTGIVRNYPYKSVACQTIGRVAKVTAENVAGDPNGGNRLLKYIADDEVGFDGLEKMLEPQLRGTRGLRVVSAGGTVVSETPPVPGKDVTTSIDIELQAKVEAAFDHVDFLVGRPLVGPEPLKMCGAAVLIDLKTGQVLSMASCPTYDLNQFDDEFPRLFKDQINRPLANRATMTAMVPGSTVKPIIGLGAITDGLLAPNDTIECTGYLRIGNHIYKDFGKCWTMRSFHVGHHQVPSGAPHPTGFLTFADAIERSCNVFHETLGDRLGLEGESKWFDRFGLGRPTGVGLSEVKGTLPNSYVGPADQRDSQKWFAAIGEGSVTATPIQMANVAATIARNGIWARPMLVARPGGELADATDLHLNTAALAEAHEGMRNVVNAPAGTGKQAHMDDLLVAAKTGSAQTAPLRIPLRDDAGHRVRDERGRVMYDTIALGTTGAPSPRAPWYRAIIDPVTKMETLTPAHAWMIGYAPADAPKIAFAVFVEYGGGGGPAAGSVVRASLEAAIEQGYLQRR